MSRPTGSEVACACFPDWTLHEKEDLTRKCVYQLPPEIKLSNPQVLDHDWRMGELCVYRGLQEFPSSQERVPSL